MAQLDERTHRSLARLRDRGAPSEAAKQRMYAALEAQLGGDGGSDDDPSGDLPAELPRVEGAGAWAAKVVGATAGLTVAGLVALRLGVELVRTLTGAPQIDAQRHQPEAQPVELASAIEQDEVQLPIPEAAPPNEAINPAHPTEQPSNAAPRPRPAPVSAPASTSTLAAELAVLEAAHAAKTPAAALLELERHLAQFPRGELADERELLRVETLCRLDRLTDAHALAERFLLERPGSALRQRIASACPSPIDSQKDLSGG